MHLLPNFDSTQIDALFAEIASPNSTIQQNMYAYNIYRRLLRIGYEAKLVKHEDNFALIKVSADDDFFFEITAIMDKNGVAQPLMEHRELTGKVREISQQHFGTTGMYSFQANFTLKYNTYDEERAAELGIEREDTRDDTTVGTIQHSSYDFHHFIQGALYAISKKLDVDLYPQMRSPKRKHF